jgi:hypothetical protein
MSKGFHCKYCGVTYLTKKHNFSRDFRSKSNYKTKCKQCYSEASKVWISNQTEEKKNELRIKNNEQNRVYRKSEKYKLKCIERNITRNKTRSLIRFKERNAKRLVVYIEKFQWQETPHTFIDIKPDEY